MTQNPVPVDVRKLIALCICGCASMLARLIVHLRACSHDLWITAPASSSTSPPSNALLFEPEIERRWGAGRSHEGSVTWGLGGGLGALMSRSHDDSPDPAEEKKEKKKRVRVIARTSWEKGMDSGTTRCGHCGCVFLRENIPPIWCPCGVELCSIDCARRHRCAGPILTMEVTDDEEEVEVEEEKQEEEEDADSPAMARRLASDSPAMLAPVVPPTRTSSCQELPALPPLPSFGGIRSRSRANVSSAGSSEGPGEMDGMDEEEVVEGAEEEEEQGLSQASTMHLPSPKMEGEDYEE